ncbi:MAG TPA: phosphatase PAP2 family protein [Solirubrobacteraceae bacterium]|nr:phosphatase PAP2 family protein [Solirubrobacteraceae bacterium]
MTTTIPPRAGAAEPPAEGVAPSPSTREPGSWRNIAAGPVVALVTVVAGLVATHEAGVPFGDPDHVGARRLALVCALVAVLVVLDVVVRAARRSRRVRPSLRALRGVQRERWTWRQGLAVVSALVGFYVTYVAYRNIKSVIPLLRPGDLFDRQLADADRLLFFGSDPAELLHTMLGTQISTPILSTVYVAFVFILPLMLAVALVFSPDLRGGLFYATALSINWGIGAITYLLIPARGPIYYVPGDFADLPSSHASYLQGLLLDQRREFLADPSAPDGAQNIAAFASLHCSMLLTAAIAAHMLGLGPRLKTGLWVLVVVSATATVHLGWHYVVDDLAGIVIAVVALAVARLLTGFRRRPVELGSAP